MGGFLKGRFAWFGCWISVLGPLGIPRSSKSRARRTQSRTVSVKRTTFSTIAPPDVSSGGRYPWFVFLSDATCNIEPITCAQPIFTVVGQYRPLYYCILSRIVSTAARATAASMPW